MPVWVVLLLLAKGFYSLVTEYQDEYGDDYVMGPDIPEDQDEYGDDYVMGPDIPEETISLKTALNKQSNRDGMGILPDKDDSHLAFLGP